MTDTPKKQAPTSGARRFDPRKPARPVGDLVSKLLSPVIEQRAGMSLDLIASWDDIAGPGHAEISQPDKLLWPRRFDDEDPFEPATLVIACEGAAAVFLQHDTSALIDRVNAFFGFAAVSRIKFVQRPILKKNKRQRRRSQSLSPQMQAVVEQKLRGLDDPDLKASFEKMARGVFSNGSQKDV